MPERTCFLVGGAAIAIAYDSARSTRDLDGVFLPTEVVRQATLTVDVASARYLLAMKLFSSRVENDADDIMFLYRQLGFTTVEEGLDLVESVYHGRAVEAKVQFLLSEIVATLHDQDASSPDESQP